MPEVVLTDTAAHAERIAAALGSDWQVTSADHRRTSTRPFEQTLTPADPLPDGVIFAGPPLALEQLTAADALPDGARQVSLTDLTPDGIRAAFAAPEPVNLTARTAVQFEREAVARLPLRAIEPYLRRTRPALHLNFAAAVALHLIQMKEVAAPAVPTGQTAMLTFSVDGQPITAEVCSAAGLPLPIVHPEHALKLTALLRTAVYWVMGTEQVTATHPVPGPLTLPDLIAAAEHELGLPPPRTLALYRTLYAAGWVTHPAAVGAKADRLRDYLRTEYGTDDLGPAVAPDGITPTDGQRLPEDRPGDGAALYRLIWRHAAAQQLVPAEDRVFTTMIGAGKTAEQPYPIQLRAFTRRTYRAGGQRWQPEAADPVLTPETRLVVSEVSLKQPTAPQLDTGAELVAALVAVERPVVQAVTGIDQLTRGGLITLANGHYHLTDAGRAASRVLPPDLPALSRTLAALSQRVRAGELTLAAALREWQMATNPIRQWIERKPIVLHARAGGQS